MIVPAIESSCDETGVGIAELSADGTVTLLADEVASSVDEHARFARSQGVETVLKARNGAVVRLAPGKPEVVEHVRAGRADLAVTVVSVSTNPLDDLDLQSLVLGKLTPLFKAVQVIAQHRHRHDLPLASRRHCRVARPTDEFRSSLGAAP